MSAEDSPFTDYLSDPNNDGSYELHLGPFDTKRLCDAVEARIATLRAAKHVWLVRWAEQDTQRHGVHGVFRDEAAAKAQADNLTRSTPRVVYHVQQWIVL